MEPIDHGHTWDWETGGRTDYKRVGTTHVQIAPLNHPVAHSPNLGGA